MEWLTRMLGMANQGSSPFGALGGMLPGQSLGGPASTNGTTYNSGQPPVMPPLMPPTAPIPFMGPGGQPAATPAQNAPVPLSPGGALPMQAAQPAQAPGGMQLPGIWGKLMGQQPQQGAPGQSPQQGNAGQTAALGQALGMLKPQPLQPAQWMPWMK